ncbi:MAG TPA: ABC transporter permease, partial [Bacteroidia bacterium]|nr:ABC transporter permease [Bacteroidia bacterium]
MNTERFLAKRIISGSGSSNRLSRPIVRISIIGIALGLAVMILTVAIVRGFQQEVRGKLIGVGSHIQVTNYDNNSSDEPHPISKNQPFLNGTLSLPGVSHVQVYSTKTGIVKTKTVNEGILLKGIGSDYDWTFITRNLRAGKTFTVSDTGLSRSIVISKFMADKLELQLNDKMVIYFLTKKQDSVVTQYEQRAKAFYISGIYETGMEDIDKTLALVDIRQLQKLNYWRADQIGGFEMSIDNYEQIDKIGEEVNELIGNGLKAETIKEINPTIFSWLELQDVNAIIVIFLMILVAGINMISALLILILERTNMIGILKALGSTSSSIQEIFLYNAAYLIGKGLLWGNVIGLGLAFIQKQYGIFKLDEATYYVAVIPIDINWIHIILLNI